MRMMSLFKTNAKHQLRALFLVCAVVVLCMETVVYQQIDRAAIQQHIDLAKMDHDRIYSTMEDLDKEARRMYDRLLVDESLANLLQNSHGDNDYYGLGELQKSFLKLLNTNGKMVSIYLHMKKSDMILSTNFTMSSLDLFPNHDFFRKLYGQENSTKWLSARHEVAHNAGSPTVIPFVSYIPQYSQSSAIVFNFKEPGEPGKLDGDRRALIVLNRQNELITYKNPELFKVFEKYKTELPLQNAAGFIGQFDHYYFFVTAAEGAFKVITMVPDTEIMGKSRIKYLIPCMVLSVLLIFMFFHFVRKVYFTSIETFQDTIRETREDLKHHFIYKLLLNTDIKREEIEQKAKELKIDLGSGFCQVIVFHIDDFYNYLINMENDDRYLKNKIVFNAIKWVFLLEHNALAVKTDLEKIAVLLTSNSEDSSGKSAQSLEQTIQYLQKEIQDTCHLTVCVGVSEEAEGFEQIPLCYAHALKAVEYKALFGKDRIIRYGDIDKHQSSFQHYPIVEMNKISGYIREGNLPKLKEKLDKLYDEYMSDKASSLELINSITTNLLYGIVKLLFEFRYRMEDVFKEDIFIGMYSREVVQDKMDYIFKIYARVIEYRKSKEEGNSGKKIQAVMEYIHQNYDKDISLTSVADELKMNSTYLSTLIKNELGFGFLDYINELRVKKSTELLKDKELTIQQIALACGYITVHSFIRNFKKYYLVTPNDFRNKLVDHEK